MVRRLLDAQRIDHLTCFLEALHQQVGGPGLVQLFMGLDDVISCIGDDGGFG